MLFKDVYKLSFTPCVFSMLFLDTPCRMFVFLLVVHWVVSSGIIKETMNEWMNWDRLTGRCMSCTTWVWRVSPWASWSSKWTTAGTMCWGSVVAVRTPAYRSTTDLRTPNIRPVMRRLQLRFDGRSRACPRFFIGGPRPKGGKAEKG